MGAGQVRYILAVELAMKASPLIFWTMRDRQGESDLALLDKNDSELNLSYKTVRPRSSITVDNNSPFSDLIDMSLPLREFDHSYPKGRVSGLKFLPR